MSERLTAEQVAKYLKTMRDLVRAGGRERDDHDRGYVEALDRAIELVELSVIESPGERRERFERWWLHDIGRKSDLRIDQGEYCDTLTHYAWIGFNAALDFGRGGGE